MQLKIQELESKTIYKETKTQMKKKLAEYCEMQPGMGSVLINFKWYIERERSICNTLNMFDYQNGFFKGLCWCPISKEMEIDNAIYNLNQTYKIQCSNLKRLQHGSLNPPTHFRSNDVIRPFQEIVNTYGIPSYREANPALFTIVTFPFLFGIMFGDIAHGLVLLTLSIYICYKKDFLIKTGSLFASAVPYRYLLLLMSIFSSFAGFLYNDFGAVPLNLASSCFDKRIGHTEEFTRSNTNCTYLFGFDPKWYSSVNELQFINSFKMKLSVIVGVLHMLLGIVLKGLNARNERKPIDFWFEFVPQFIFMVAFFGYMNFMIIIKWLTDWGFVKQDGPSIITLLIGIPLKNSDPGPVPLYGNGYIQQIVGQTVLCTNNCCNI